MKKKLSKKFLTILTSILLTFAVYTGALLIFLYVQGWRLDFTEQTIKKVGVLTVESSPILASIHVGDEYKGKTNKSMTLDVDTYEVTVSKDGYYNWSKEVSILEEKSTPIYPYLIMTDFTSEEIYQSDLTLDNFWVNETNDRLILLLKDEDSLQLFQYNINRDFWVLNASPVKILDIPIEENESENTPENIDIQLSPSGKMAVLTITNETNTKYLIPTTKSSTYSTIIEDPLELTDFQDYTITWSNDEEFLILESENDVISYDLDQKTKYLLLKKTDSLDTWSTDPEGYFYIFKHIETSEKNILKYTLKQYNMDGSAETTVISSLYFQNNTEYIENYRTADFKFSFFTNSPENTQTIGEITKFAVNSDVNGLYIKTTQATYWYDVTIEKYITISTYPADLLEFAPDDHKMIIKTPSKYQIFIFDKEEGDHTITIGTHDIENLNFDQIEKINWLSNSDYIQFEEDEFIYISDKDGDNKTPLTNNKNILYWTITSSREKLLTLTNTNEQGLSIILYTIH